MAIIDTCINTGICACSNELIEDVVSLLGGTEFAYIMFYAFLIGLIVLMFVVLRSVLFGFLSGITAFSVIIILGNAGCIPLPSSINVIGGIIIFIITVTLLYAIKSAWIGTD